MNSLIERILFPLYVRNLKLNRFRFLHLRDISFVCARRVHEILLLPLLILLIYSLLLFAFLFLSMSRVWVVGIKQTHMP